MKIYYPALTTGALFTALLILDLSRGQSKLFIFHLIFCLVAVVLMIYLGQKDLDFVAWGIFAFPILLLGIGLLIGYYTPTPGLTSLVVPSIPSITTIASTGECTVCNNPISTCVCPSPTKPDPVKPPPDPVKPPPETTADATCANVTPPPVLTSSCGNGQTQCVNVGSLASA